MKRADVEALRLRVLLTVALLLLAACGSGGGSGASGKVLKVWWYESPGSGNLWVVPKNAANKQLAYDFFNIAMRPGIQKLLANHGAVPVSASTAGVTSPLNRELITHGKAEPAR